MADSVSLSCNSGSKRCKTSTLERFIQLSEEFESTASGVLKRNKAI